MENLAGPSPARAVSEDLPVLHPRRRTGWLLAGIAVMGLAAWQGLAAMHNESGLLGLWQEAAIKMLPSRLWRSLIKSSEPTAESVRAYLERAKRGMTDQEIRWVVDDFRGAGLDVPPVILNVETIEVFRAKQKQWYLRALIEGLGLTSTQQEAVRSSLESLPLILDQTAYSSVDVKSWLLSTDYAPWNLCVLTPEQENLTLKAWVATDATSGSGWTSQGEFTIQDPETGNLIEWSETVEGMRERMGDFLPIGNVFPLTPQQPLLHYPSDRLKQAHLCQAAQLRMALLLEPSLGEKLSRLMETAD